MRGSLVTVKRSVGVNNVNAANAPSQQIEELDDPAFQGFFSPVLTRSDDAAEVGVCGVKHELEPGVADFVVKRDDFGRLVMKPGSNSQTTTT